VPTERFQFEGEGGYKLAASLDLPCEEPLAFALFAHCFTCGKDALSAKRISTALAAKGIAVLRFDFTGLGSSEGEFANATFSSNVADLVRAADHLRKARKAPAILIGHSLGGAAILAAAKDIPEAQAVVTIAAPSAPGHVTGLFKEQIENIRVHGVAPVVAINSFPTDHPSEHQVIRDIAAEMGARAAVCTHFADGGRGAIELAEAVAEAAEEPSDFHFLYPDSASLRDKIAAVATQVYGADGVSYSTQATRQLDTYERAGFGRLPVCIAKTHLSISSDPSLKGAPTGWTLPVREVRASVGAGFVYPICGDMRTMPGLGTSPAASRIDLDEDGLVVGLS